MIYRTDYLPGKEEELRKYIDSYPLDFVIGSIHYIGEKPPDPGPAFYMDKDLSIELNTNGKSYQENSQLASCQDQVLQENLQPDQN